MFKKLKLKVPMWVLLVFALFIKDNCLESQFLTVESYKNHLLVNKVSVFPLFEPSTEFGTVLFSPVALTVRCRQFGQMNREKQSPACTNLVEKWCRQNPMLIFYVSV